MSKLTEDMVIARTKGSGDIRSIKKLNCWGASLKDIALLREMSNLEVIAFSVNQISCLADFQFCTKLQELYLRGNNISDINQVCYLQSLNSLKFLWLNENPIENTPMYRETVIRTLPFLKKLDNNEIDASEVENAKRVGRELVHPSLQDGRSPSPQSVASSRSPSPTPPQQDYSNRRGREFYEDYEERVTRRASSDEGQQSVGYSDESRPSSPRRTVRHSPPRSTDPPRTSDAYIDRRDCQGYEQESPGYSSARQNYSNYDDLAPESNSLQGSPGSQPLSPVQHEVATTSPDQLATEEEIEQNNYERTYRQVQPLVEPPLSRASTNHRLGFPSRPAIRSANILSSVLLLIKELDVASLEVVSVAVQSRIG